jgi:hypothetical protein
MGVSKYGKKTKSKNIIIPNTIINEVIPYTHGKPMTKAEIDELYSY